MASYFYIVGYRADDAGNWHKSADGLLPATDPDFAHKFYGPDSSPEEIGIAWQWVSGQWVRIAVHWPGLEHQSWSAVV